MDPWQGMQETAQEKRRIKIERSSEREREERKSEKENIDFWTDINWSIHLRSHRHSYLISFSHNLILFLPLEGKERERERKIGKKKIMMIFPWKRTARNEEYN